MDRRLTQEIRPFRRFLILTVSIGTLATAVTIAQMAILARLVDRVFLEQESLAQIKTVVALLLAAIVVRAALLWLRALTAEEGAIRVKSDLRDRLLVKLARLGPSYTRAERTGEIVGTTTEGIERLDPYFARYLPQVALSLITPLMILAYVFPLDLTSALILLFTAPIIPILMIVVGTYAEGHIQRQWLALSRMSTYFLDVLQGLPTLKLLGRGFTEAERVERVSEDFRTRTMKVLRYAFLSGLVLEFMTTAAIALVAVSLGVRLVDGHIPFQPAFLVLLLTPEFYRPLRDLGTDRHAAMEGKAAAERIFEILDTPVATQEPKSVTERQLDGHSLELRDVRFTYPDSPEPALQSISLTVPAGSRTALVGASGSGKSTLINLLMRFVEPGEGTILCDGVQIGGLAPEEWRRQVSLVSQHPYLFYGSVRENIRMARPEATIDEVRQAAVLAGAAQFIESLPDGYDTELGERGNRLSQGQAQRIALARAFLKDAPIVLLDEPTSSLDPESEELIRQSLERLAQGRTVLIVAHRLKSVYSADQIAVLERGRLVELGTHAELLKAGGSYTRLFGAGDKVTAA
ncbi:MAG: thiol reductant ABC exporter subunit CydD [Nitrolancea sp.]